ncbi:MAG: 3D domain-containing protein [Lacrimispora sp.]|uniref:3D domain-containing protein n=1 Tax=Lacrimispora sp. TaxID=2719234 RepID=UPI0039E54678
MKSFPRQKRITVILTILCVLLLSMTSMAATENSQAEAAQSASLETAETIKENTTNTPSEEIGPGIKKKEEPVQETPAAPVYEKGESLGNFGATAYCPSCTGGGKTYSGTIPQAGHTLSADLTLLPLGTKVMIGETVYTVEDTGSSIKGKKVDIFVASRHEALQFGRQTIEIFAVKEVTKN